jgi:MoaA/NifB/PqqE/SkfB family radical SAM enzyme
MVKRFLLREEYFGGLLYDRNKEKQEILNRWQTKALQLAGKLTVNEMLDFWETNPESLVAENYDKSMDEKEVKEMNSKLPSLQGLVEFLDENIKKGILVDGKLQAQTTKTRRKLDYPMLNAPLGSFHIGLTNACNMACAHCYNSEDREKTKKVDLLTTEQIFDFFNQAYSLGYFFMKLQGGEPVLRPDWKQIAQKSIDLGMATTLYSGGYFKGRQHVLDEITDIPFSEIRLTFGGLKDMHNQQRPARPVKCGIGQPSYNEIINSLDYLLSRKANVKLNFVLGKNNIHQVEEFVRTMAAKSRHYGKPFDINFGPQRPFGEDFTCPGDGGKNMLDAEGFYKVNTLVQTLRESSEITDAGMNLLVVFDLFAKKKPYQPIPAVMQKNGCGLGIRGFSVSYSGDIGICSFMNACGILPSGGNIKESNAEEIWFDSPLLNIGRQYKKEQCEKCPEYTNPCIGICPAMAVYEHHKKTGKYKLVGKGDLGCFNHLLEDKK